MPPIGDLFKSNPSSVQETINSVFYLLKQRINDIDSRNEQRQRVQRAEQQVKDVNLQLSKAKERNEELNKEIKDLRNRLKNMESKHKTEVQKHTSEKEELIK